ERRRSDPPFEKPGPMRLHRPRHPIETMKRDAVLFNSSERLDRMAVACRIAPEHLPQIERVLPVQGQPLHQFCGREKEFNCRPLQDSIAQPARHYLDRLLVLAEPTPGFSEIRRGGQYAP